PAPRTERRGVRGWSPGSARAPPLPVRLGRHGRGGGAALRGQRGRWGPPAANRGRPRTAGRLPRGRSRRRARSRLPGQARRAPPRDALPGPQHRVHPLRLRARPDHRHAIPADRAALPARARQPPPALRAANPPTTQTLRWWDPGPLLDTYRQLQELRLYYDFHDVDVDRYTFDGTYQQVMLAARELNQARLPADAQTWINQH